jgi:hypothetical protein
MLDFEGSLIPVLKVHNNLFSEEVLIDDFEPLLTFFINLVVNYPSIENSRYFLEETEIIRSSTLHYLINDCRHAISYKNARRIHEDFSELLVKFCGLVQFVEVHNENFVACAKSKQ